MRFFIDLVSVVGWCGAFLLFWASMILMAPQSQKQEIIDIYILFKWQGNYYYAIAALVMVFILFFAQNRYYVFKYKNPLKDAKDEINRLADEKSKLQKKLTGKELHHSKK